MAPKNGNTHLPKVRRWEAHVIAFDDTELNEWLLQANEEDCGEFLSALAEAVVTACAEDYTLVRPALMRLKRKYRVVSSTQNQIPHSNSGRKSAARSFRSRLSPS
jgi:FMN phosphatase YigB (HAD superfamily)